MVVPLIQFPCFFMTPRIFLKFFEPFLPPPRPIVMISIARQFHTGQPTASKETTMFHTITNTCNKTLIATLVSGAILAASVSTQALAGGEGGGGREDIMVSMTNPNGGRDTLRGHRDGSRTFTRTNKRGKIIAKRRTKRVKKVKRPRRRDNRASISMTNPDGTRTTVRGNPNGSRTIERFDQAGNRISLRTTTPRRPGTWRASGTNHTTGRSGRAVGNFAGAVVSVFGFGLGF